MRLLIVDDSTIIRSRIARIALDPRTQPIQVVGLAHDGLEAVALFETHRPDAVTMDLTMPNMDGIACIEALIKIDPEANILVVSALKDKATAVRALMVGARGFLPKPFTDEQLAAALQELTSPNP